MALRVLLADESSTIKKVFQLALQDFAVEVKPVNVGVDVINVAKQFKPDIIFADVLLQKRNGYDVSSDVKKDSDLANTPVVLMWSGFMELDDDKFQASHANAHLEKPFEVNALRTLIKDLVPRTATQRLANFLNFPDMPDFDEAKGKKKTDKGEAKDWNMDSFEPIEVPQKPPEDSFKEMTLPPVPESGFEDQLPADQAQGPRLFDTPAEGEEDSAWKQQDIGRFKLDLGGSSEEDVDLPMDFGSPEPEPPPVKAAAQKPSSAPSIEVISSDGPELELEAPPPPQASNLSKAEIEQIVRAEARKMIEDAVWKVVPDLAEQIIERELKKLLESKDY